MGEVEDWRAMSVSCSRTRFGILQHTFFNAVFVSLAVLVVLSSHPLNTMVIVVLVLYALLRLLAI